MKKLILILLLLPTLLYAAQEPLPAEKVFNFSANATAPDTLTLTWRILPHYFIYKDRYQFEATDNGESTIGKMNLPKGMIRSDDIQGEYEVYRNKVRIPVRIQGNTSALHSIKVTYQGCSDAGFCYPAVAKQINFHLANRAIEIMEAEASPPPAIIPTSEQDRASALLASHNLPLILLGFFGFGLLLAFTPCVLPMVPILSGVIMGPGKHVTHYKAFLLSLTYVLAMSATYAVVGVIAALAGGAVQAAFQNPWVIGAFSIVFVILALSLFGFYELQLPQSLQEKIYNISSHQEGGHFIGVAIMGVLSTLIVSPCVTAPLVGALSYIGQTGDALLGGSALFTMGLGMGVPLILIGTSHGSFLPKAGPWMDGVKGFFGVLLLAVAIWLLERVIPGAVAMLLWAALLIVSSVYLGAFRREHHSGWSKFFKGVGLALFIYGVTLIVGAGIGNIEPLSPLKGLAHRINGKKILNKQLDYTVVKTVEETKKAIEKAGLEGKMVMLDFYADWCVSCKIMEKTTFSDEKVNKILEDVVLLKADVTLHDKRDKVLLKSFNVVAPPTLIFFNKQGKEIVGARIVGEINAKMFYDHIMKFNKQ